MAGEVRASPDTSPAAPAASEPARWVALVDEAEPGFIRGDPQGLVARRISGRWRRTAHGTSGDWGADSALHAISGLQPSCSCSVRRPGNGVEGLPGSSLGQTWTIRAPRSPVNARSARSARRRGGSNDSTPFAGSSDRPRRRRSSGRSGTRTSTGSCPSTWDGRPGRTASGSSGRCDPGSSVRWMVRSVRAAALGGQVAMRLVRSGVVMGSSSTILPSARP